MAKEWYDIVDENDRVIGRGDWNECHANGLIHRTVYILIFNSKGQLLLQKRSKDMMLSPGKLTASACGHVVEGETYEAAAHRELKEELGINTKLTELGRVQSYIPFDKQNIVIFKGVSDGPYQTNKEIERIEPMPLARIKHELENQPVKFGVGFKAVFNHLGENNLI